MQDHFPEIIKSLPTWGGHFPAYKLEAKNSEILMGSYPKGTVIEPHTHETENVGVITKGELVIIMNNQEKRYGPGDWYHIPANQVHAARCETETCDIEFWFKPNR